MRILADVSARIVRPDGGGDLPELPVPMPGGQSSAALAAHPRVVMLSQTFLPRIGGLERHMHGLATGLIARGYRVEVLTRRYAGLSEREPIDGLPVCRLGPMPADGTSRPAFALRQASFTIRAAVFVLRHARRFDVLHAMGLSRYAGLVAAVARFAGLRTVGRVTNLGTGEADFRSTPLAFVHRALLRRFDAIIAVNQAIASMLERQGVPRARIVPLPNFVDTDRFRPATPDERLTLRKRLWPDWPDSFVLLFVGRLEHQKGSTSLLQVVAALRELPSIRLAIVAEGSERRTLEAHVAQLGLRGRVQLFGAVSNPRPWYQAADMFVLPSRYEGMPNCLLEAMACGLPVVANRIPGIEEALGADCGALLDCTRSPMWAATIGRPVSSPAEWATWSMHARSRACREFDREIVTEKYLHLYRAAGARVVAAEACEPREP